MPSTPRRTSARVVAGQIARHNVRTNGRACQRCDATEEDLCHHLLREAAAKATPKPGRVMAQPDLQVLGGASGVAVAWPLIEELERAGRFVDDAQAWRLSLDFVRLAEMLDAAPEDDLLARAYRAVVAELRNPGTDEGNRDQDVKALMSRIRRGRRSHEWYAVGSKLPLADPKRPPGAQPEVVSEDWIQPRSLDQG
jgi:hypothetical protein